MKSLPTFVIAAADIGRAGRAGMAERTHVLQHDLSRGYGPGLLLPFLAVPSGARRGEVQRLQPLFARSCKAAVHRLQEPSHRLRPLRGVHGLPGRLSNTTPCICNTAGKKRPRAGSGREPRAGRTDRRPSRRRFLSTTAVLAVRIGGKGAGEEGGRRTGRHRGQEDSRRVPRRSYRRERASATQFRAALHRLPALRVGLSQRRAAPFDRFAEADAARNVLRTRLLPSGVHEVFGGLPCGSHPTDHRRAEKSSTQHRSCRMDTGRTAFR